MKRGKALPTQRAHTTGCEDEEWRMFRGEEREDEEREDGGVRRNIEKCGTKLQRGATPRNPSFYANVVNCSRATSPLSANFCS
jgi:hypothetical protein